MAAATTTKPLYHGDSYLRAFDARVIGIAPGAIALDQTAFFPGGGGQLADRGTLTWEGHTLPLAGLKKLDGLVWHALTPAADTPPLGASVHGELDWPFRYQMMRTHTALHMLCGIIFRDFGAQVTGGQMYADHARMDFAIETFTPECVRDIETRVNEAVAADHPVKVYQLPREQAFAIPDLIRTKINLLPPEITEVRIVEIVGLDLQADGGTHVHSTDEVRGIRVLKTENKGQFNKRMEIALAEA